MTPYSRALGDPHIHAIARELNELNRVTFPSEPCPHPTTVEEVGGDGKTYIRCTHCGVVLRAK